MGIPSEGRPSVDNQRSRFGNGPSTSYPYENAPGSNAPSVGNAPSDPRSQQPRFRGPTAHDTNGSVPSSPADELAVKTRDLALREKTQTNGSHGGGKPAEKKKCMKCGEPLTGQFVRALGGAFHLDCFQCQDCGEVVASKFFPVGEDGAEDQYPLCETDYFRRLDLICSTCGGALRGAYITAIGRKYHVEHFTCSICPITFGAKDSYYEHEGDVYCHYHYSTRFAQRCNGCQTAILKQFVEIFRNGTMQHWHPECYMIHKFWNVRLSASTANEPDNPVSHDDATEAERTEVRLEEEHMEEKVYRIWSVLSSFEESSAACISDMLLHVSNGAYVDGVLVAKKFIWHVDMLFTATDGLDQSIVSSGMKGLAYGREAKLLCKKIVAFFSLLSKTQETGVRRLGVTQELLSLVTGLAHYLKLLIRITLQGALKMEREQKDAGGLHVFLGELSNLESLKDAENSLDYTAGSSDLANERSDLCSNCNAPVDNECLKFGDRRWHRAHIACSSCRQDLGIRGAISNAAWSEREQRAMCHGCLGEGRQMSGAVKGFQEVTRLQQYVYLLRVALARLLSVLRSGGTLPHTSDDPNLTTYDSNDGHRIRQDGNLGPPLLKSNSRSKSYAGRSSDGQPESTYEETVGEMKRLRSTRMDKHLSTTIKKARTSRIIDGPQGQSTRPGSAGADGRDRRTEGFQIIEDQDAQGEVRSDLTFGNQDALTLDDIPRIVAAEQAKEQRPNAYRHAQNHLISNSQQPRLMGGHQRSASGGQDLDRPIDLGTQQRTKRYFSELSALEYFIVRHIAVLSMEPLLEGHFTLEELLALIDSNRKPTFWGKFGKAFRNDKVKNGKKKGCFGVALDTLVERDGVESSFGVGPGALRVPSLIDDSIAAMRQMDMSVEGVFRKNGNIRGLRDLSERIDAKEVEVDLTKETPVQVAALLKKFLRSLPDPLLTCKLHHLFITSQKIANEEKRRRVLHLTCCLLPKTHRDSVEILFSFLNWVASFSGSIEEESGSKMDTHNLATVFAPNILYAEGKGPGVEDPFLAIEAVFALIEYNDQMCEIPEDIQSILIDSSLYNNNSDITTKEILKRYGDIGKSAHRTTQITQQEDSPLTTRSKDSTGSVRPSAPQVTKVDTDPNQATAWQKESSVRHVQGNGGPAYPSNSNQNTPPQPAWEFGNPNSPYHQRAGSSDSTASHGNPNRHYRNSGRGK